MTRLIEWLLGLHDIRLGRDAPLLLKWQGGIPAWALFCFALVALACIVFAYRREQTTVPRRGTLAVIRAALVALAIAALCRPILVLQRNRVEPSHIALLVDSSVSMTNRDQPRRADDDAANNEQPPPATRLEQVRDALLKDDAAALRRIEERNGVQLSTFAGGVETLVFAESPSQVDDLKTSLESINPDGPSTDVVGAIKHVLDHSQGRRLAAIVLATDGQSTQTSSLKDAIDAAVGRQIPIYCLRIGSTRRPADIEVGPLRAPERVFVHDLLAIEAKVTARSDHPSPVKLSLVDERTGTVAAAQSVTVDPQAEPTTVELRTKTTTPGQARFRVQAESLPGEINVDNNVDHVDVTILDDRLRVLYVDGYPRYEYRYLKNALLREQTLQLSVLLLEADEDFVQEGTDPIRRFPETPEELNRFDVVLFGDVDPRAGWLSAAQMNMLLDYVGNDGGGFGLIAGERWSPRRFLGTPLEKLIPVTIDPQFLGRYDAPLTSGFHPALTPEGRLSRILRFAPDRAESERILDALPELYWVARTLGVKPGASALLEAPMLHTVSGAMPVVVLGRYGAGKVFFQATDDTWRWRRHTGEMLHDGYWVQVARELMKSTRVAQDRRYTIRTDRRIQEYGIPVRTQVEITDSQLLAEQSGSLQLTVQAQSGTNEQSTNQLSDASTKSGDMVARFEAHRLNPDSNVFEGTFVPPSPGVYQVSAKDLIPRPGEHASTAWVRVQRPDLEWRRPEADHETLEKITAATGGHMIELNSVDTELGAIRDRRVQIPDDVVEPLWDSKIVLLLFVGLVSVEWILRKFYGLL